MRPAVDVYGLGGSFYFMLTGAHPFRGQSTLEIQEKKLNAPLPSVNDRLKGRAVPEMDEIIHHCLQPHPDDRPPDMLYVKREIDKIRSRFPKTRYTEENRNVAPAPVRKRRI